jgi:hypothetical protein
MDYPSEAARTLCQILSFDPKDREGLDPASIVDWQSVCRLAVQQNLAPLLYRRIKDLGITAHLPCEVYEDLRNRYLYSAASSMRLYHEFGKVMTAMQAAHIPIIPLKGIYLAQTVYKNPALRPMCDIDILVKPNDITLSVDVLKALGYSPTRKFDCINDSTAKSKKR